MEVSAANVRCGWTNPQSGVDETQQAGYLNLLNGLREVKPHICLILHAIKFVYSERENTSYSASP